MKREHYNLARKIAAAPCETPEEIEALGKLSGELAAAMGPVAPVELDPDQFIIGSGKTPPVPDGAAMFKSSLTGMEP